MKIIRVLLYEGDEAELEKHLSDAKPEGIHDVARNREGAVTVTLRVMQLPQSVLRGFVEVAR